MAKLCKAIKRVRIMNIYLDNLKPGEYKQLSKKQVEEIMNLNKNNA